MRTCRTTPVRAAGSLNSATDPTRVSTVIDDAAACGVAYAIFLLVVALPPWVQNT